MRSFHSPAVLLVVLVSIVAGCGGDGETGPKVPPVQAVLERQVGQVEGLLTAVRTGPLIDFDKVVVTVDERLIAALLESAMPYERVVDDKYRIRVSSAQVSFRGGLALARLEGRASLAGHDEETVFADLNVYGALEIAGFDTTSGVLRAKVNVIGFEVPQIGVMGITAPVRELVEDLAKEPVEDFNVLASNIEIPIAIEQELEIPGVGPDEEVTIEPATVPLRVAVSDVKVLAGKIWISIDVGVKPGETAPPPSPSLPQGEVVVDTTRWHTQKTKLETPATRAARLARGPVELLQPPTVADPAAIVATNDSGGPEVTALRARYAALVDSVLAVTAADTLLYQVAADSGDVGVSIRPQLIERLVREAVGRYLDRVDLDIALEEDVREGDEVEVKTPFGKVKAGRWDVHVTIHRIRLTLGAKPPDVTVQHGDRLRVTLPIFVRGGTATATVRFNWDAKGAVSNACHDFNAALDVDGKGIPKEYVVFGDLVLTKQDDRVVARPEFPVQKVRISAEPSPQSWAKVRETLTGLNDVEKCGIGLEVLSENDVIELLQKLLTKGFKVKLPTKIVPSLELPASLSESVDVEDQKVELRIEPLNVRMTSAALWYSANVGVKLTLSTGEGRQESPKSTAGR
jgi:hypothetical protein